MLFLIPPRAAGVVEIVAYPLVCRRSIASYWSSLTPTGADPATADRAQRASGANRRLHTAAERRALRGAPRRRTEYRDALRVVVAPTRWRGRSGNPPVRVLHYERRGPDVELMIEQVVEVVRCLAGVEPG